MSKAFRDDKEESYTEESKAFDWEVQNALRPIFEKYKGIISKREMAYVAAMAVNDIHLMMLLDLVPEKS